MASVSGSNGATFSGIGPDLVITDVTSTEQSSGRPAMVPLLRVLTCINVRLSLKIALIRSQAASE